MTNHTLTLDQTYSDLVKSDAVLSPKLKFNPTQKTLVGRLVGLIFTPGELGQTGSLYDFLHTGTNIKDNEHSFVEKINYDATSMCYRMKLPTLADYEDLENLNDADDIENILYQASKKFRW
jgi:hypothetical protein